MTQAACPRSKVDSSILSPRSKVESILVLPQVRGRNHNFSRGQGVEDVLSLPIQSSGVIPLIQRSFKQHPLDLLCLDQGSNDLWAGHGPF